MQPARLTRPNVGRSPLAPHRVHGETMLPSVSLPIVNPASPATHGRRRPGRRPARTLLDVPRIASHGPPNHWSPWAKAPRVNLATSTAPASSSLRATVALCRGDWSLTVRLPRWSCNRGRRSGPSHPTDAVQRNAGTCRRQFLCSAASACLRASSSVSVTTHLRAGSYFFKRSRVGASSTRRRETSFLRYEGRPGEVSGRNARSSALSGFFGTAELHDPAAARWFLRGRLAGRQ